MSLVLKIESELDERSATAAANRAERVYADASRNISKSMTSQIGDGAQAAGKAVEKMADSARASYQKVLKAQDELAQQERQLKQMREEGARGVEVQAERVRQARRAEKDAIREAAGALNEYERSVNQVGETGLRAGAQLRQGLRSGIESALSDATRQFGAMGNIADSAFAGISRSGGMAALGVAGIGAAIAAAGQQLYELGAQWDEVGDKIAMRTGKFDGDLQGITDSVKRVASDTAAPIEAIGDISGQVVQSMKLAGPQLDQMTQRLAILQQEAGNPVGVRDLAKAYNIFGIEAKDQVGTLDKLFNVSQQTGIPMQELVTTLTSAGRATKQFGLDAGQTAGLLAALEGAGVNGESSTKALTIALKNFSKEGKDAGPALASTIQQIQDLADAGRDSDAAMLAASTFGGKSYLDMLNAIKDHRLDINQLSGAFQENGDTIVGAAEKTADLTQEWTKFKNNLKVEVEPAATSFFNNINAMLEPILRQSRELRDVQNDLKDQWQNAQYPFPKGVGPQLNAQRARLGLPPIDPTGGLLPGAPTGDPALSGLPNGQPLPAITGSHAGIGGSILSDWPVGKPYWGNAVKDAKSSSSSSVAVPYGPGYGRAPRPGESTAMYDAEQNVLEAQHKRATAEAVLAQVMADSTHTTNDEIKAQNDLTQARKGEVDAQMRLHDTSVKAAESLNKATGQLGEFGASIDADFGISKGLPGIVENITKMLGNFALAGPMAQMNAISQANPNQGSGLMGMLASQGAFGSQYTPQAIAAASGGSSSTAGGYGGGGASYSPSALGPAALRPGGPYAGDAALLSHVPKGIGEYDNVTKDLSKGLVDCASGVEDLVNIMDGKSTAGGSLWTGNASKVLPGMGFLPGMGGPGDFRIGYNDHHMQATLPGGTNVNFGSTSAIRAGGIDGGMGAFDPSFTQHYYRPAGVTPATETVNGGGGWGSPTPDVANTVAGSPGQGFPLPWSLGGGPLSPAIGPGSSSPDGAAGNATGAGRALVGAGRGAEQPADPYGVAPTTGPGGGGIGITPGGTIDTAIGIAAAGANMFAPGAGAAAQAGIKLASRAIQYGGQVAGIAADGLLQTFLPAESQKAGSGWLQRGVGALASVKPALPNLAGGKGSPQANPQQQGAQGQGDQGQGGNTVNYNTTVNSNANTIGGAAKDAEFHFSAQNQGPGW